MHTLQAQLQQPTFSIANIESAGAPRSQLVLLELMPILHKRTVQGLKTCRKGMCASGSPAHPPNKVLIRPSACA